MENLKKLNGENIQRMSRDKLRAQMLIIWSYQGDKEAQNIVDQINKWYNEKYN